MRLVASRVHASVEKHIPASHQLIQVEKKQLDPVFEKLQLKMDTWSPTACN